MEPISKLLLPPPSLTRCISAAVIRDTRDAALNELERLNYFPASPMVTLTIILHGQLHMSDHLTELAELQALDPLPPVYIVGPQSTPIVSWSPASIVAVTIAFYPDAWSSLGGRFDNPQLSEIMKDMPAIFASPDSLEDDWARFCASVAPVWRNKNASDDNAHWPAKNLISDWMRHFMVQAAMGGAGQTARSFERRIKRWTGHSKTELEFYSKIESLHKLSVQKPNNPLSQTAQEADFSDQSHMGRSVKRVTGFSPAQLNKLIDTNEAFWCYRLLGERF